MDVWRNLRPDKYMFITRPLGTLMTLAKYLKIYKTSSVHRLVPHDHVRHPPSRDSCALSARAL